MNRPRTIIVSEKFKDILKLEAATHGKSIVKYTEELLSDKDNLKDLAEEWREKYNCKYKARKEHLDMP